MFQKTFFQSEDVRSVFHPTLKKMVKLAVMEAEGEGKEHVAGD